MFGTWEIIFMLLLPILGLYAAYRMGKKVGAAEEVKNE